MNDPTDAIMDRITGAIRQTMESNGDALVEEVKVRISVPVDYSTSPPTRSKRGEPPRKDTGALYASIQSEMSEGADTVRVTVLSNTPYARELNDPKQWDRPIWGELHNQYMEQILRESAAAITALPTTT